MYVHGTGNELLEFMHTQPYDAFRVLHYVSEESVEAMSAFIHRLLGELCLPSQSLFASYSRPP